MGYAPPPYSARRGSEGKVEGEGEGEDDGEGKGEGDGNSTLLCLLLSLETRSHAGHCQSPPFPDIGCHEDSSGLGSSRDKDTRQMPTQ